MITAEMTSEHPVLMLRVRVSEQDAESSHEVTLSHRDLARLGRPGETPAAFVTRCFAWMAERHPGEPIQKRFDISALSEQFTEFELEIRLAAT